MKKNVLVFPCGSEIGLEAYKSINLSTHFNVYGGSSVDDHGKFVYKNYVGGLPSVEAPEFVGAINKIVDRLKIDFIFPTHDSVVLKLAEAKQKGKLKCEVVTSPAETCRIARSKLRTYDFLKDIVRTPRVYKSIQELSPSSLPVFLKPEVGQGTKGTYLANSLEDVAFYTKKDSSLLMLEYLPGEEYTVECFTDKDGKLLFCEGRRRVRVLNGISVNTLTVADKRFVGFANKINQKLELRGAWFFQLKEAADGEVVLLEIAPRIAGTMCLIRCKGVNLVLLSLFDVLGYDLEIVENDYHIVVDRALENRYQHNLSYQHAYIDLDDLLIVDGQVNLQVMAFVYQCLNKKISVHLLTRHKQELSVTLKKYRLEGVFDEVININPGDQKHSYIKEKKAIFIDDSFAERKKVKENCKIAVFDSHMIEALMEKF